MWWRISLPEDGAGAWSERLRTLPSAGFKGMPSIAAAGPGSRFLVRGPFGRRGLGMLVGRNRSLQRRRDES